MAQIIDLLQKLKSNFKIVLVYLAEAHADDVWPLGYGVAQSKNLDEKLTNCHKLLSEFPKFHSLIDHVLMDNMENEFILKTGAWPEGYFFADQYGKITWKVTVTKD